MHFARCHSSQRSNLLNNAIFVGVILLVVFSLVFCPSVSFMKLRWDVNAASTGCEVASVLLLQSLFRFTYICGMLSGIFTPRFLSLSLL